MSDTLNIGQNTPEYIAYKLMKDIMVAEQRDGWTREYILSTYSECLTAVQGRRRQSETGSAAA